MLAASLVCHVTVALVAVMLDTTTFETIGAVVSVGVGVDKDAGEPLPLTVALIVTVGVLAIAMLAIPCSPFSPVSRPRTTSISYDPADPGFTIRFVHEAAFVPI